VITHSIILKESDKTINESLMKQYYFGVTTDSSIYNLNKT